MTKDNNRLLLGDSMEIMKSFNDNQFEMILTDIPYNNINRETNGLRQIDKGIADSAEIDIPKIINEFSRITKGSVYIFCEFEQVSIIKKLLRENGFSVRIIVWEKTNPSPMNGDKIWLSGIELCVYGKKPKATFNGHCRNTVFKFKTVKSKLHPTEKPQELLKELIKVSSNEGDLILDPFAGSGSLGLACVSSNRHFVCIEKDPVFFKVLNDRLSNTNQIGVFCN